MSRLNLLVDWESSKYWTDVDHTLTLLNVSTWWIYHLVIRLLRLKKPFTDSSFSGSDQWKVRTSCKLLSRSKLNLNYMYPAILPRENENVYLTHCWISFAKIKPRKTGYNFIRNIYFKYTVFCLFMQHWISSFSVTITSFVSSFCVTVQIFLLLFY